MGRYKYPRTHHVPWSPGATSDDKILHDLSCFYGKEIVVTEKMDGENSSLYSDGTHARSIDSGNHPSRNWLKGFHAGIAYTIPEGYRICGENLYAKHSLGYSNLASYFYAFSVWDQEICLSWDETLDFLGQRGVHSVPVLFEGPFSEKALRELKLDLSAQEGWVVRIRDKFRMADFGTSVAKWVRAGHVVTDEHWAHKAVTPNGLGK